MIRLKSTSQILTLEKRIPEIVIRRMVQLEKDCMYDAERDGFLIIVDGDDDLTDIPEAGPRGLMTFLDDDGFSLFEYVGVTTEDNDRIFECVIQIDDSKAIAIFVPESIELDSRLRHLLETEAEDITT